ncbi:MAG TPA: cytochrome c3 family protein [Byssovorax sp.]|jgi:hypothetical protein
MRLVTGWFAVLACALAFMLALASSRVDADTTPIAAPAVVAVAAPTVTVHGVAPLPDDAEVPVAWMPPGAAASPVPSEEIFPPQTITIRFNHKKHVDELKQPCKVCHAAAYASDSAQDTLLPRPQQTCDNCHDVDHANPRAVKAGKDANGQCGFCHLGAKAGDEGKIAPVVVPRPKIRFTHKKHLDKNIQCGQCHGQIDKLELATRDQLPRMAGCFTCHAMSGAAQGQAKGTCTNCHLTQPDGRIQQTNASVALTPPRWLHNADHTPDWIERHKGIAADDAAFCGNCHKADYCTDCHDGRVRPRNVHPNDWLSMHPEAARQDNPRCVSCHAEQTFCADCHRRTGVAKDTASGNRQSGRRFHPPPQEWTTAPRGPNHHSWEAMRNLNACVSCHTERDCATCHATKSISGGMGVDPHPTNFMSVCRSALRRNPRPCLVCHQPGDSSLVKCQ